MVLKKDFYLFFRFSLNFLSLDPYSESGSTSRHILYAQAAKNTKTRTDMFCGSCLKRSKVINYQFLINLGGKTSFGIGCKYTLGPDASIRAKVDNSSIVSTG